LQVSSRTMNKDAGRRDACSDGDVGLGHGTFQGELQANRGVVRDLRPWRRRTREGGGGLQLRLSRAVVRDKLCVRADSTPTTSTFRRAADGRDDDSLLESSWTTERAGLGLSGHGEEARGREREWRRGKTAVSAVTSCRQGELRLGLFCQRRTKQGFTLAFQRDRRGCGEDVGASEGEVEARVHFNVETAGALPGRGICCLAAERGERGQEEPDKEKSWVCARISRGVGRVRWREDGSKGSRSARGEKTKLSPARCWTYCRLPEHARERARGTGQSGWRAW
jgi:hypothetical protein